MELHHDGVLAGAVIVSLQTPFFKIQLTIQTSGRDIRTTDLERHKTDVSRFCFVYRLGHQSHRDTAAAQLGMHGYVEDVAFVSDQPSAEKARRQSTSLGPPLRGDQDARKRQHEFALERFEAPRLRE